MKHDLYTFVLDVDGGSYISQILDHDLHEAILSWSDIMDGDILKAFNVSEYTFIKESVEAALRDPDQGPVALANLKNIWFMYFSVNDITGYLN
ncbi:hypothetical protein QU40_00140, partial [Staphylococcus aureus]|uniref:hypothetical protein n=1 Tax=Staphylococcus aureus TaxID=1280 RepID=UPI0005C21FE3